MIGARAGAYGRDPIRSSNLVYGCRATTSVVGIDAAAGGFGRHVPDAERPRDRPELSGRAGDRHPLLDPRWEAHARPWAPLRPRPQAQPAPAAGRLWQAPQGGQIPATAWDRDARLYAAHHELGRAGAGHQSAYPHHRGRGQGAGGLCGRVPDAGPGRRVVVLGARRKPDRGAGGFPLVRARRVYRFRQRRRR